MLAPFIAPILTAFRWLAITALPFMLSSFVVGLLIKLGVAVTSWAVISWAAEYLRDFANAQLAVIGGGEIGASVMGLLSLFGVFEGISLIVSCYLAKATWLSVKPSLTWLNPPAA
ncbi:DUF2523 family protein [Nitrosomonas oligotropha]|uniref:DUF2523 domain-containing protein n=1 Tax=Nitrosomonas oligotropha TaxID=42354 RepID=A0A1H8U685_9PROT|nr:DUF2523 family protein [Nitrosomonas oligotropha]MBX9915876.1 DUF2523 domain-containing protein [Nitrosomonas sp.]OQW80783.1 MAG: hypothetical protein BVN30_12680 [Proteobacteria bacterium ST_bin16]TXI41529.1 MAG: DUF2523 domain-containing protein [Nitrosomonas sp.]SDX42091.1 Protein of unknown function [Nitrosomonas oligotropha]SEO98782.1 Protein of unknown function [Nitrosomonas oligotropha]